MSAEAVTLDEIRAADWSLALDRHGGLGRVVEGIDDVNQAIEIILTTPKGSDPLRPTFGADLWQYLDFPISTAVAAIVREVTDAVTQWEPRVKLLSVRAAPAAEADTQAGAHLKVIVKWELELGGEASAPETTTVSIIGGA
ncbi:MAG: GPW/gp25 family protein [Candidatus Binataceae bacterium]